MKLHVYEQDNSNLVWVHEELWTKEELKAWLKEKEC